MQRKAAAVAAAAGLLLLQMIYMASANSVLCPPNYQKCRTTDQCVSLESICDHKAQCSDKSDEEDCDQNSCGFGKQSCSRYGNCINRARFCDGKEDCIGGTDEKNCSKNTKNNLCAIGQFKCRSNGNCIHDKHVCDGFANCEDGSDEVGCGCRPPNLQCQKNGECVLASAKCDGHFDCSDGEDEALCKNECSYHSDVQLKNGDCTSKIHICDGSNDNNYFDEICKANNRTCSTNKEWLCESGTHCVPERAKCDGFRQCPDGSDELQQECTAAAAKPTKPAKKSCKSDEWLCTDTKKCVSVLKYCQGLHNCPHHEAELEAKCLTLKQRQNPCKISNGGCQQKCSTNFSRMLGHLPTICSCKKGYRVDAKDKTKCVDIDECKEEFGACSQKCENTDGSYKCSCSEGFILKSDRYCEALTHAAKIVANESAIIMICKGQHTVIAHHLDRPAFLSPDPINQRLYFYTRDGVLRVMQVQQQQQKQQQQQQQPMKTLLNNTMITDIAFDSVRSLLFFIESRYDGQMENLMALSIRTGRIVRVMQLHCPRSLTVMPHANLLFVTQLCGDRSGIYSLQLNQLPLNLKFISSGGSSSALPSVLTTDSWQVPARIYWADNQHDEQGSIYTATANGFSLHQPWHQHHVEVTSMAVFENSLTWVDSQHGKLMTVNKFFGRKAKSILQMKNLREIAIWHPLLHQQQQQQQQQHRKCYCGHVCFASSSTNQTLCLCDAQYKLNNQTQLCEWNEANLLRSASSTISADARLVAMQGKVGSIAFTVICILSFCVIVLIIISVVCIRKSASAAAAAAAGGVGSNSFQKFGADTFDYFVKEPSGYSRLTKAASQATLREENLDSRY